MRMGNVWNSCYEASISKEIRDILNSWRSSLGDLVCETCDLLASEAPALSSQILPEQWLPFLHHPEGSRDVVDSLLNGQRT